MYESELEFLKTIVKETYNNAIGEKMSVRDKGICDVVTNIDLKIENVLTDKIKSKYPNDRIHSEEFASDLELSDRTWIIDPIDGTYNFSVGSHDFGIQCAFFDKNEVVLSVIFMPEFDELYWASINNGAYLNGNRIKVSDRDPDRAIVSIGDFPHSRPWDSKDQLEAVKNCVENVARIRMFGASSKDYVLLASGKTDGVLLYTKNKWDLASGICLCREAGATVLGIDGEKYDFSKRGICIVNKPELYNAIFPADR